jgi:hypothetical protein
VLAFALLKNISCLLPEQNIRFKTFLGGIFHNHPVDYFSVYNTKWRHSADFIRIAGAEKFLKFLKLNPNGNSIADHLN